MNHLIQKLQSSLKWINDGSGLANQFFFTPCEKQNKKLNTSNQIARSLRWNGTNETHPDQILHNMNNFLLRFSRKFRRLLSVVIPVLISTKLSLLYKNLIRFSLDVYELIRCCSDMFFTALLCWFTSGKNVTIKNT